MFTAVLNVTVADPLRKFVTIEGLKQNHDYNFTVSALTKKGSGPAVSITIRTRINCELYNMHFTITRFHIVIYFCFNFLLYIGSKLSQHVFIYTHMNVICVKT